MAAPRVFVSHASEDKERFVLKFAERLRENGIDAWLDKWEMLPGDSLIDKIFSEGIKEAAAVIVVVSRASIQRPWVKEELNAAAVKRIDTGSKLIPVVIDDCEVPDSLRTTLWEKIEDVNSYETSFQRICASILGRSLRPPIGEAPYYLKSPLASIPGLNHTDHFVLKTSCEYELRHHQRLLEPKDVFMSGEAWNVPECELIDSLTILDHLGLISLASVIGAKVSHYRLTRYGFEIYAEHHLPQFEQTVRSIGTVIANDQLADNQSIASKLNQPLLIIDFVLERFEAQRYVQLSEMSGGFIRVYNVSPLLRRWLEQ